MTDKKQPEALRLADRLDLYATGDEHQRDTEEAAAELRRQHAELETLRMGYAAARLEIESLKAQSAGAMHGEHAELRRLSDCCPELNLSNYGPDDVDDLNGWAIEVSQCIDRALASAAAPAEDPLGWRRRALEAEATVLNFVREVNGPTFMGEPAESDDALMAREMYESQDDSLLLCASDLQHSAIYDNHVEMQSCMRAVAARIAALVHAAPKAEPAAPAADVRASHGQAPAGAKLPEGWVPLAITYEGQYPEEVAYGPQRMMDRLGKWLRKYFDFVAAAKERPEPATDLQEDQTQPWYDLAWKHGARRHASFDGDELTELSFRPAQFDAFCAELAPAAGAVAPAAVAGASEAVAYLDIGAGGYLDLGTDLTDEALSHLPKGRHALVIAGTYGIDGYIAAPTAQSAPQQEPSYTSVQLAEMVMSDCGHSSIYMPLLNRVAARIDAHVERCLESNKTTQQEAQEPVAVVVPCYTPSGKRVALYSAKQDLPVGIQLYTAPQPSPAAQVDALSDAVRVPLDSLHADAAYLIGRLREGSMPYARVIEIIRERIDAAKAAIRARAAKGDIPDVVDVPDQCPYFGPSPHRDVWLTGWYAARAAQEGKSCPKE